MGACDIGITCMMQQDGVVGRLQVGCGRLGGMCATMQGPAMARRGAGVQAHVG